MSIVVELSQQELAQVRAMTRNEDDAEAVRVAVREFVRTQQLRELKAVSGKVEFDENWQQLEAIELTEQPFPQ